MNLNDKLALAIVSSVMDDYESIESIYSQLCDFLGEMVEQEVLFSTFCSLEAHGLVHAYRVDSRNRNMVPINSKVDNILFDDWFLVTDKGRQFVEDEWECTFGISGENK